MWPFKKKTKKQHFQLFTFSSGPEENSVKVINDTYKMIMNADVPYGENGTGQNYLCYLDWKNVRYNGGDGTDADLFYRIIRPVAEDYDPRSEYEVKQTKRPLFLS